MPRSYHQLTLKPWNSAPDIPKEILLPKGMLGDEERRCFWWLARHHATGRRAIVDAGAYIGASGFCFASGAAANPETPRNGPIIFSYDYFRAIDQYVAEAITKDLRPCALGDDYLDVFEWQVGRYQHLVRAHTGDFNSHIWSGDPIDICFIDIAKTRGLNSHALSQFLPCLIPGESVLIQQDFYHCWHPYMQIAMEYLRDELIVIDPYIEWQSRLYGIRARPSAEKLQRIADWTFSQTEERELLDRYIEGEEGDLRAMAHVVKLSQLQSDGDFDAYDAARRTLLGEFNPEASTALWSVQLKALDQNVAAARAV